MSGYGATEFSPYSQWWNSNDVPNNDVAQAYPVPDQQVEAKPLDNNNATNTNNSGGLWQLIQALLGNPNTYKEGVANAQPSFIQ